MIKVKTHFFTLALLATTASSSIILASLHACAKSPRANITQTQTINPTQISQNGGMNHGEMMMNLGPASANYDLYFIDMMMPHHQGAIEMAKEVLAKSKRNELKKLATDIIQAQNKEIKEMREWRRIWYPKAGNKPMFYHAQMGGGMEMTAADMKNMMMMGDLGKADANFDLRFLDAMIPHHEGAIMMAKDAEQKSKRPEIKALSQAILTSQQAEINQMKAWKKAWYKM
jgi:uncharacterized protein (DUF305 family)